MSDKNTQNGSGENFFSLSQEVKDLAEWVKVEGSQKTPEERKTLEKSFLKRVVGYTPALD